MKRRFRYLLFHGLTVASAVLCLATSLLWLRSNQVSDWVRYASPDSARRTWTGYMFGSNHSRLSISSPRLRFDTPTEVAVFVDRYRLHRGWQHETGTQAGLWNHGTWWNRLGFAADYSETAGGSLRTIGLQIPHAFVFFLSAVLPGYWIKVVVIPPLLRQARRRKKGYCHRCGYDVRASPERCPECGTPVSSLART